MSGYWTREEAAHIRETFYAVRDRVWDVLSLAHTMDEALKLERRHARTTEGSELFAHAIILREFHRGFAKARTLRAMALVGRRPGCILACLAGVRVGERGRKRKSEYYTRELQAACANVSAIMDAALSRYLARNKA